MWPRIALAAAAAVVSVGLAGCGGAAPSFAAQANAICTKANRRIASLPPPKSTVASYASAVSAEVPIVRREVAELAVLKPPSGKRSAFATTLADARADVALADSMVADLERRDESKLSGLLVESVKLDRSTRSEARALGIEDCGRSGSPPAKNA